MHVGFARLEHLLNDWREPLDTVDVVLNYCKLHDRFGVAHSKAWLGARKWPPRTTIFIYLVDMPMVMPVVSIKGVVGHDKENY